MGPTCHCAPRHQNFVHEGECGLSGWAYGWRGRTGMPCSQPLVIGVQPDPSDQALLDENTCTCGCNVPHAAVKLHDGDGLDGVGRLLDVVGVIQAPRGLWDARNTLASQGEKLKGPATDRGAVAPLVQCADGHQGVPDGQHMENFMEGESGGGSTIRCVNCESASANGRELLLVRSVKVDRGVEGGVRGEIGFVRGNVTSGARVIQLDVFTTVIRNRCDDSRGHFFHLAQPVRFVNKVVTGVRCTRREFDSPALVLNSLVLGHDSIRRPDRLCFGLLCLVSLPGFGSVLSQFLLLGGSAIPCPMPRLAAVMAVALAALLLAPGPRSCESVIVTFSPDYLILSHYLTAYHWDCLSFILSPIPSTVRALYHPVTCLSGLVIFYLVRRRSITITATTGISGTTTGTLSISGFPSTTTSSICLALCTI
jgi:hypothetical protein